MIVRKNQQIPAIFGRLSPGLTALFRAQKLWHRVAKVEFIDIHCISMHVPSTLQQCSWLGHQKIKVASDVQQISQKQQKNFTNILHYIALMWSRPQKLIESVLIGFNCWNDGGLHKGLCHPQVGCDTILRQVNLVNLAKVEPWLLQSIPKLYLLYK